MDVRVDVIGALRVRSPDVVEFSRSSHRRLLAILTLHTGAPIETGALIDRFWPEDPPATARASIQTHISALRRALGAEAILFDGSGYSLDVEPLGIDARVFETLWRTANDTAQLGAWPEALASAHQAQSLWRGAPYPDLRDDWFAQADIARLTEMHLALAEVEGEAMLQLGRHVDAIPRLEYLVVQEPGRERLWELLMKAQYRLGRHADAIRAFHDASEHLAQRGLEPSERLRHLEEQILLHDRALTPTPHNLTSDLDRFIGRSDELQMARRLVTDHRLVTLTGSGGVGKTRLAEQVCKGLFDRFGGGIWMVRLESIDTYELVLASISTSIGLRPRDADAIPALLEALSGRPTLIVLDNCEHLLPTLAKTIEQLLNDAPGLTILATSREPLRLPGEALMEVCGLPVTGEADSGAIALFTDRARSSRPIVLDKDTLDTLTRICERLDGSPLAIELAAARTSSLGLHTIADRLDEQLGFLTSGAATAPTRHQTIRATIDWSYRLLTPEQRSVLMWLSVFRNGFSLDAAEDLLASTAALGSLLDILPALVDKSLLTARANGPFLRYRMLETVRQFAWEQLAFEGQLDEARHRHARWAASVAAEVLPAVFDVQTTSLGSVLSVDADNLQAALRWADEHEPDLSGELSEALAWHWYLSGRFASAADRVDHALAHSRDGRQSSALLALGAQIKAYSEDIDGAIEMAEWARRSLGDPSPPEEWAWVLSIQQLCYFMSAKADPSMMLEVADEALSKAPELGRSPAAALTLETAADGYCWNGLTAEGLSFQDEAIRIARASENRDLIDHVFGHAIYNLMLDPVSRGTRPGRHLDQWMALVPPGEEPATSTSTDWLPWIHLQRGDLDAARRALRAIGERKREGYNRTIYQLVAATVAWMGGDMKEASAAIADIRSRGINERWWHVFYPLAAEIATDCGDIDGTRRLAETFLAESVHPSGEAAKLGVLMPLVRAEVDVGVNTDSRSTFTAQSVLQDMRRIVADHPPLTQASTSLLTHTQNLAFGEAELTRLTGPNPDAWLRARHNSDYEYYRIYAAWRMSEALLALGHRDDAATHLGRTFEEATRMRFTQLARMAAKTAQTAGIRLDPVPRQADSASLSHP